MLVLEKIIHSFDFIMLHRFWVVEQMTRKTQTLFLSENFNFENKTPHNFERNFFWCKDKR